MSLPTIPADVSMKGLSPGKDSLTEKYESNLGVPGQNEAPLVSSLFRSD